MLDFLAGGHSHVIRAGCMAYIATTICGLLMAFMQDSFEAARSGCFGQSRVPEALSGAGQHYRRVVGRHYMARLCWLFSFTF